MRRTVFPFLTTVIFLSLGLTNQSRAQLGPPPQKLPNMTFRYYNPSAPKPKTDFLPLAQLLGKPTAIIYWKLNDTISETELKAFQALASIPKYKGKINFLSAVSAATESDEKNAIKRIKELKITIPVIFDRNQLTPYLEAWFAFPRYAIIDKKGYVRIWNCSQLNETVGPNMTFLKALQLAAEGKELPTMRGIGKPKNTYELVGQKLPNVALDDVNDKPTTVHKYLKGKPIIVAFWSVTCPHCQQVMPVVGKYWLSRRGNLDMISITRAPTQELRKMIRDLFKQKGVSWPVAYAPENATLSFFNIVKVPTIILADKNGIIRYVWIQPDANWIAGAIENAIIKFKLFE